MSNIFKRKLKVAAYDISAIKLISALFGLWIGATWPDLYHNNVLIVWVVVAVLATYILRKYWKQMF